MRTVYIAGPLNATTAVAIAENIARAEQLALQVWQLGAAALCPHTNAPVRFQAFLPNEAWLAGDLELLRRCDALLMLSDWARSPGARLEHQVAKNVGLPIFYDIAALSGWLKSEEPDRVPLAGQPLGIGPNGQPGGDY